MPIKVMKLVAPKQKNVYFYLDMPIFSFWGYLPLLACWRWGVTHRKGNPKG